MYLLKSSSSIMFFSFSFTVFASIVIFSFLTSGTSKSISSNNDDNIVCNLRAPIFSARVFTTAAK